MTRSFRDLATFCLFADNYNVVRRNLIKKTAFCILLAIVFFSCATTPKGPTSQERAEQARNNALSVRADIAARDDYDAAQASYEEALALGQSKKKADIAAADAKFAEADAAFTAVYGTVKPKYDAAQKEIDAARAAIKNVEDQAALLKQYQEVGI